MIATRLVVSCARFYGSANSFGDAESVSRTAVLKKNNWAVRLFNGYRR